MKKRIFSGIMVLVMVLVMVPAALAENVCNEVSGNPNGSVTFTATTGKKWIFGKKITFKQDQGIAVPYVGDSGGDKHNFKAYGHYYITWTDSQGNSEWKNWIDGSTSITLRSNETYTISVEPWSRQDMHARFLILHGGFEKWDTTADWTIKGGSNITYCQ